VDSPKKVPRYTHTHRALRHWLLMNNPWCWESGGADDIDILADVPELGPESRPAKIGAAVNADTNLMVASLIRHALFLSVLRGGGAKCLQWGKP